MIMYVCYGAKGECDNVLDASSYELDQKGIVSLAYTTTEPPAG
jgi:hypothetical protein